MLDFTNIRKGLLKREEDKQHKIQIDLFYDHHNRNTMYADSAFIAEPDHIGAETGNEPFSAEQFKLHSEIGGYHHGGSGQRIGEYLI